jgi:2-haloacid dehalogenase
VNALPDPRPVVIFDIVGTLVDEMGTIVRTAQATLGLSDSDAEDFAGEWNDILDARFEDIVTGNAEWRSCRDLRQSALHELLTKQGLTPGEPELAVLENVDNLFEPFNGVAEQLDALSSVAQVVGLTNASLSDASVFSARGGLRWHALISTELVRTFKPRSEAYQLPLYLLEVDPTEVLFVAAHPWDLKAAAEHGFDTAFISRPRTDEPAPDDSFDYVIESVGDLVEIATQRAEATRAA